MFSLGVVVVCSMMSAGEEPYPLWDTAVPFPKAAELSPVEGARFSVIKERVPDEDGFNWLHGVAVVWHKGELRTFFGHNKGKENTPTEIAQERVSTDAGRTWGPLRLVASHTETEARSHGVYLSHEGQLWLFLGRFGAGYVNCRAEGFVLDEATDAWVSKGIVAERFWPCDEPRRMRDGNWAMAGMEVVPQGRWAIPAVAISHGADFTKWDTVTFPVPKEYEGIWGETAVIVTPDELVAVVRAGWKADRAMVSTSTDCGRTWTPVQWTNLRMPCTKVYGGVLSTGQRYLVGTIVADHKGKRHPLTIAVTKPGGEAFCRIFRIRDDVFSEGPGESVEGAYLSYPYAVEHEGYLYVGYSNDGARGHNLNSGELAVIPVSALAAE